MLKKLAGYVVISFLSFCVFSLFLNTAANAKDSGSDIFASVLGKNTKAASPTPPPPIAVLIPTKPPSDPSPTHSASSGQADTPTIVPTAIPTSAPTSAPTATPTSTPTDTPTPTPTETPTPTGTQPTGTELDAWFTQYANAYPNVDRELLRRIAQCESGFNTNASNGDYLGMYQFSTSTWNTTRTSMGADPNPDLRTNAEESIKTAAYKISNGGASAWPAPTC